MKPLLTILFLCLTCLAAMADIVGVEETNLAHSTFWTTNNWPTNNLMIIGSLPVPAKYLQVFNTNNVEILSMSKNLSSIEISTNFTGTIQIEGSTNYFTVGQLNKIKTP